MQKIYKFIILILFLIGGTLFLFNNFISNYNSEIEKTKYKINGIEVAQKVQRFILKIQKLRGYSQFDQFSVNETEYNNKLSSVDIIKSDVKKDIQEIKALRELYPALYDNDYDYVMDEIKNITDASSQDKTILYEKYTHSIEELKEKVYYLGFKSKLLLESDGDKYFFVEIMLKHLPNLIEVVGKIRAKTSKAILDNSTDNDLLYSIKNNCLLCEEHIKQIYKNLTLK